MQSSPATIIEKSTQYYSTISLVFVDEPILGLSRPILPHIVAVQGHTIHSHKQEQSSVGPVSRGVALCGLRGLVDPDSDNLSRRAHGNIERNGQTDARR